MLSRIHHDDGFSLVELLVTIMLMLIVGGVVTSGVVAGMRTTVRTENRITALTDAQKGLERVTRHVRASDARAVTSPSTVLVAAGPTRVVADLVDEAGNERIRHHYDVLTAGTTTRLCHRMETFTLGTPAPYTATTSCDAVLVGDLQNAAIPVFQFQDDAGAALASPIALGSVRRVVVSLERGIPGEQPLQLTTSVTLRNEVS